MPLTDTNLLQTEYRAIGGTNCYSFATGRRSPRGYYGDPEPGASCFFHILEKLYRYFSVRKIQVCVKGFSLQKSLKEIWTKLLEDERKKSKGKIFKFGKAIDEEKLQENVWGNNFYLRLCSIPEYSKFMEILFPAETPMDFHSSFNFKNLIMQG